MPNKRRVTFWWVTSVRMGPTLFTTCVSWILTLKIILRRHRRSSFRMKQGQRKILTWRTASRNVAIFSRCCLCRCATGCGGGIYPEKDSQPPCNKVSETLLKDIRIRQEQYSHQFGAGRGWRCPKPIPIGAPGKTPANQKVHPLSPWFTPHRGRDWRPKSTQYAKSESQNAAWQT